MKFKVGDSVKLRISKSYEDGTEIPKGTPGLIEVVHPVSDTYTVKFDGYSKARRVPEGDLAADNLVGRAARKRPMRPNV